MKEHAGAHFGFLFLCSSSSSSSPPSVSFVLPTAQSETFRVFNTTKGEKEPKKRRKKRRKAENQTLLVFLVVVCLFCIQESYTIL